ncbi:MAG: hypothetical protein ACTHMS_23635 [Jatrophihabitans sp.]|uniref:hypothetical protein n=1 Tax=Jatrophihabitans sp. TaxID=1932789 RepID=UPI003F7EAE63
MSFSFAVPSGPASEFADRAAKAKADLEAASAANDYALTQLASDTADAAIKAATEAVAALGDGIAAASIGGHHSTDGVTGSSISVNVTVTPAPKPAPTA